ncbi:MAG TPA: restriction endonuclease [Solirubrobacteraceae bacterium]|nr:restriction endonuclease [Solirubrobacteraceae bacterium]
MFGAVAVYMVWGLAVPILLRTDTIEFVSFATGGAIFAGTILFARAIPFVEARLRRQQLQLTTNLRRLSGREFETLVQELFEREGWKVAHTGGHGQADGNIDLILRRGTDTRLVQCKQWTARDIGVDEVRKLGGTLLRQGLTGADGTWSPAPASIQPRGPRHNRSVLSSSTATPLSTGCTMSGPATCCTARPGQTRGCVRCARPR